MREKNIISYCIKRLKVCKCCASKALYIVYGKYTFSLLSFFLCSLAGGVLGLAAAKSVSSSDESITILFLFLLWPPLSSELWFYISNYIFSLIFPTTDYLTRMTTSLKVKINYSDDKTNIIKYRVSTHLYSISFWSLNKISL